MAFERKSILTIELILDWADSHYERTGEWPVSRRSGPVLDAPEENWCAIDVALRVGCRGLPRGLSLPRLLDRYRGRRNLGDLPLFRLHHILAWADVHHQRTGEWPLKESGAIPEAMGETWSAVDAALHLGHRGLPSGSSLARLLSAHRGVRNHIGLPPLNEESILAWADAHRQRTGDWPHENSGPIPEAAGETWDNVQNSLLQGRRGLTGGSSLSKLLVRRRGARRAKSLPPLSESLILEWAGAHFRRTGRWPVLTSGEIEEAPGESWKNIDQDLRRGQRGLRKGGSLPELLARERGVRNPKALPDLQVDRILEWADAHHARSGRWPTARSGGISEAPGETWAVLDSALFRGNRGLSGGSSLARLLAAHRGVRNDKNLPRLSEESILAWADAHRQRTGNWPNMNSGTIPESQTETWGIVQSALSGGTRGLPGGSSLSQLLMQHRGTRNIKDLPPLTESLILEWADVHFRRTGKWPRHSSGPIEEAPGETWGNIGQSLRVGSRGLRKGGSLPGLLEQERGVANRLTLPKLQVDRILEWADAFYARSGRWPTPESGSIPEAPGEKWSAVYAALRNGNRGLPGGSSLSWLIRERDVPGGSI